MIYSGTVGLLVAIVLLHFVATAVVPEAKRIEGESERVVGGRDAVLGQFPWAAVLFYNDRFICTGSIVSPNTYMTAAHCVVDNQGRPQPVGLFHAIAHVRKSSPSYRVDFSELIVHPEYNGNSVNNDVAIFKTSQPIPFSKMIHSVCIAGPDTKMDQYENATAMGWGSIIPIIFLPYSVDTLQYAEQKIVANRECGFTNSGVDDNKICARGKLNGICSGDSGGPLVHLSKDKPPVQIGIASYGNIIFGCWTINPAVFVRVSSYHDFIIRASSNDSLIETC